MSDTNAAVALATALWLGIGYGIVAASPPPSGPVWVATSSEKLASHPSLMRASYPVSAVAP
jgi:hypothetical protein